MGVGKMYLWIAKGAWLNLQATRSPLVILLTSAILRLASEMLIHFAKRVISAGQSLGL